jgi:hypothetical protein
LNSSDAVPLCVGNDSLLAGFEVDFRDAHKFAVRRDLSERRGDVFSVGRPRQTFARADFIKFRAFFFAQDALAAAVNVRDDDSVKAFAGLLRIKAKVFPSGAKQIGESTSLAISCGVPPSSGMRLSFPIPSLLKTV